MTSYISDLYVNFLDAGYTPNLFWELSIGEVTDMIDSYLKRQQLEEERTKAQLKQTAVFNHIQAQQIYNYLSTLFSNDVEIRPVEAYFPELFKEEAEKKSEEEKQLQVELHKAQFEEFAYWHNQRRKELNK
ncbi:hypothetical protein KQI85_01890 [Falcatimonas sp. MSJ-15]|uniref:hypothetical protein n=1 Tax=Falcatimonas sp. MSJ-15 TaxID=2841515 RepID=UPI001C1013F5|nr:hypothetical protein [Falcatimonas sp. MSJ-15]MBU5469125.1 hypothetical protein [Falcatimonas sp. MSJ-15]